jgi:hypothetical protein
MGGQAAHAGRDALIAGRDLSVFNDNRRPEAWTVPDPAVVDVSGRAWSLPRVPARVFEGREAALDVLGRALGERGGALVTQLSEACGTELTCTNMLVCGS